MSSVAADAQARLRALDARRSFIVQAPAGSGKTGLLVQRFLLLLSLVQEPEEVLAITFTRKAAAEMRGRIIDALHAAAAAAAPTSEHDRLTWQFAGQALAQDRARGWCLLDFPNRLRIQTIDGLCGSLTRQMPVMTRAGAALNPTERAAELYREAAQALLQSAGDKAAHTSATVDLLLHLDNDWNKAQELVANMLAKRDQWLRHLPGLSARDNARAYLESGMQRVVADGIARVNDLLSPMLRGELLPLIHYAAENLLSEQIDTPLATWLELTTWPPPTLEHLAAWRALVPFLLTKAGELRRSAKADNGFPAKKSVLPHQREHAALMKLRFETALDLLQAMPGFHDALRQLDLLPATAYDDEQWRIVQALVQLLPTACAELRLVFRRHGVVDFTEISHAAALALGTDEAPTDLALALDYRVSHILVDEFQDTSFGQYELLRSLTAGWQPDDGRTVFLVGDPMQSIYRFREAQVGLFLWARQHGLGHIPLESVNLSVNFRSTAPLVEWFNGTFACVFPRHEDVVYGAVPYSSAAARPAAPLDGAVHIHPLPDNDAETEARHVVDLVRAARAAQAQASVAVLVQTRRSLAAIAPALRAAGIPVQAVEIESLATRPVIQDLLALTRALLHPADHLAWYAVLRAPWCAIDLATLLAMREAANVDIAPGGSESTARFNVCDAAERFAMSARCSDDARARLMRPLDVLRGAVTARGRVSLRRWVETTWWQLGGPACVDAADATLDAGTFFDLLDRIDQEGRALDADVLAQRVAELFASGGTDANAVQLMTIHKSKGLQFDVVIVPGMSRKGQADAKRLLLWQELPSQTGSGDMVLAPVASAARGEDTIYKYVADVEKRKAGHELGRLLYVAATRACRELHLLGYVSRKKDSEKLNAPQRNSMLALLWSVAAPVFEAVHRQTVATAAMSDSPPGTPSLLKCLVPGQALPAPDALPPLPAVGLALATPRTVVSNIEYLWATPTAMAIGTVVHQLLRQVVLSDFRTWNSSRLESLLPRIRAALRSHSVPSGDEEWAGRSVVAAVCRTLEDDRGRWLLDGQHVGSQCEWAVSAVVNGELRNIVIDRSFIDRDGTRWIVDYKTGSHAGSDVDAFLDNERIRYSDQLKRYVELVSGLESRPIRAGLYFPLLGGWREIA